MVSMVEVSHQFLTPVLHKQAICLDGTLGQGKDTAFFLKSNVHHVFAFDIQPGLIASARIRFSGKPVSLIEAGHEHLNEMISSDVRFDAAIFNFGWDPKNPDGLVSQPETSVSAVLQALDFLRPKGRMALVFYPHETGKLEKQAILASLENRLDADVLLVAHPDWVDSPSCALITKKKK